jgi:hypothetical protein
MTMFDNLTTAVYSAGRAGNLLTLAALPEAMLRSTFVVVPEAELDAYYKAGGLRGADLLATPHECKGIAAARQWMTEWTARHGDEYLLQLSDDMKFFRRISSDDHQHLRAAEPEELRGMVEMMRMLADGTMDGERRVHVGVSARGGNNRQPGDWHELGRMCDIYMHHVPTLAELGIRWDRVQVMEDFDVTLQLLRCGYPNAIVDFYAWDQRGGSNAPGGCSAYRTPQVQEAGAKRLAELHPGFVRAAPKKANNWKGAFDGERWDVTVQWRKAYQARDLQGSTVAP